MTDIHNYNIFLPNFYLFELFSASWSTLFKCNVFHDDPVNKVVFYTTISVAGVLTSFSLLCTPWK